MAIVETQITAVAVYPDRARLTRCGSLHLEPGIQALEVVGLPLSLSPDSVRAAARGTGRARLQGVQVQRKYFVETPAEQVRDLEKQLEAVQDELSGLAMRLERLKDERIALTDLEGQTGRYAKALAAGQLNSEGYFGLLDALRGRLEALDGDQQQINIQQREAERRKQKLQSELDRWRGQPRREQFSAVVEVEALEAGDLTLELTYVVSGAGWQPLYDLRLQEQDGTHSLEVGYLAQVTQRSGENWDNVDLTLSTARPALAGRLPELDPWFIQPRPVPPPMPMAATQGAVPMRMLAKQAMPEPVEAAPLQFDAQEVVASVQSAGASVTYHLPTPVSVPADGDPHKVTVARYSLEPKLDYVTAPRLTEAVYRRAKAVNDSPYTLLPGQASLFLGDEFVGSMAMELAAPNAELELYLGVDDRVAVERELKRREVDKKFIGNRRRLLVGYEIRLQNLTPAPARLRLQDQIPVARHEEIKVRLESVDPKPAEQTELNLLNWDLTLAPQEKRLVRFDFSIEYPTSMDVIGLP